MVWPTFFAEAAARAVALATRTSLGVGGRPEFLFEPQSAEEALEIVQRCRRAGVPLRFLGGGTNLLVEDGVLAGAVMATRRLRALDVHEHAVRAEAGASFPGLVNRAAALQIPRLSGCPGIPGSVGGAVTMNAGGPRACTAEALLAVEGIDARGRPFRVDVTAEAFGYRASPFDGALVTAAWFRRDPSLDQALASATRREAFEEKRRRQPLGQRSAG